MIIHIFSCDEISLYYYLLLQKKIRQLSLKNSCMMAEEGKRLSYSELKACAIVTA